MKYLFLMLTISGCGINITSDPVNVNHTLNFNFEQVMNYCKNSCEKSEPENVEICTNTCYIHFLDLFMSGIGQ